MSKRSVFTTITPLPSFLTRDTALSILRDHYAMIDLNPLVIERHKLDSAPPNASPEESRATWYQITDKITYMPGVQSSVSYNACMHDLTDGLQTHIFAPAGVEIRGHWLIGGNEAGETPRPAELGLKVPSQGLYLQEETYLRCNFLMTSFIKKNLKKSHEQVVANIVNKARSMEARPPVPPKDSSYQHGHSNSFSSQNSRQRPHSAPRSPTYSTFASESSPELSSQSPQRYPPEYQHYRQDSEPVFPTQRTSFRAEQNMDQHVTLPATAMQPLQRPPAELAG